MFRASTPGFAASIAIVSLLLTLRPLGITEARAAAPPPKTRELEPEPPEPGLIQKAGKKNLYGGKLIITVTMSGDSFDYRIAKVGSLTIRAKPGFKKGKGWFLFATSATDVWIFDGEDKVDWYRFKPNNTLSGIITIGPDKLDDEEWQTRFDNMPKVVYDKLPNRIKALRKKK